MKDPAFKDSEARERIEKWYDVFAEKLDSPEHLEVETSHGPNHTLAVGDRSNPPLVCIHGAMGSSAHTVAELARLAENHYLLAPDIPGQSVHGLRQRLPLSDGAHGRWLLEWIEAMELERPDICAVSWGGFVAMDAITIDPSCVDRLVLLVPAGVVNGPFWKATTQVMIPLGLYKLFPNEKRLRKLMDGLMTTWDDDWAHYLGDALRSFNMDFRPPPLTQPEQLEDFDRPTLVVAAEDDLSFPGEKLLKRMDDLIPHAETELIEGSRHMPPTTEEFRRWMANRIDQFLAATETENVSAAQ